MNFLGLSAATGGVLLDQRDLHVAVTTITTGSAKPLASPSLSNISAGFNLLQVSDVILVSCQ